MMVSGRAAAAGHRLPSIALSAAALLCCLSALRHVASQGAHSYALIAFFDCVSSAWTFGAATRVLAVSTCTCRGALTVVRSAGLDLIAPPRPYMSICSVKIAV